MRLSSCHFFLLCLMSSAVRCLEINQRCYNRCLTSHSACYWRFKQCWARSQLVVALDPSSVIAPQGLLSTQWLLGNVVQADMQLPNLPYSVVLSPAKTWKMYYPASSWMSNWECGEEPVDHGNQIFPLGIQGVPLSHLRVKLQSWVHRQPFWICWFIRQALWNLFHMFILPEILLVCDTTAERVHGYLIPLKVRQRFVIQRILSKMLVLPQPGLRMCWQKIIWCFIPSMNNTTFSFGDPKVVRT